jgi:hypothetical protein
MCIAVCSRKCSFSAMVFLCGIEWCKCVKNPTIELVGTSTLQKIPHSHKTLNHKMSRRCTPVPPAALHSLSMATSVMDPNRSTAAPYESNVGGWRQGLRLLRLIPLFGAPKWHPSENWEMGGAPGLGGRHSTVIHNNQPNDGVGCGGGMGEETRPGGTCERGRLPVV